MANDNEIMFSVEVLTYNQKEYIAQTLQSIIDQEHNYRYEILVSDDCSTDGTQDVIKEFQKKYPDVVKPVYNENNLGAMANYYATVARAKGKYLMGCAGDDYWLPGKVKKQIEFMERNLDFAICYGKADCIDLARGRVKQIGAGYVSFKDLYYKGDFVPQLTICARMSFFKQYLQEIQPENKGWLMEDYPFLIYAAFESLIYFMDETFAVYRIIKNSLSHQVDIKKRIKFEKSEYDVRNFFSGIYSLNIEAWDERKAYAKLNNENKKFLLFVIIKKIIKCLLPYGFVAFVRRVKGKRSHV